MVVSPPLLDIEPKQRDAVVRKWLAQTFRTYPEQVSRFLGESQDPFLNPVGRVLKEGLPVLFDELAGGFDKDRVRPPLDEIVHIRAVQDFTASEAVGFVLLLKRILRNELNLAPELVTRLDLRIDELSLLAFDLYAACREQMAEIRLREAKRRMYVPNRVASRGTRG